MTDATTTAAPATTSSATCLGWKRAEHMPPELRLRQGLCPAAPPRRAKDARRASTGSRDAVEQAQLSYTALFPPASARPLRGVLLVLHGIHEHSERYFHLFEEMCARNFGVLAYDLRSHGKSVYDVTGTRGHVERFESLVDDTNAFLRFAQQEIYPSMGLSTTNPADHAEATPQQKQKQKLRQPPLILLGVSLGTLVGLHTVLSEQHTFAGIILTSPAVSVEWTWTLRVLALFSDVLAPLLPRARLVPGVNEDWLCRDPEVTAAFRADPLTTNEAVTCRMGQRSLQAMRALEREPRVAQPDSAFCAVPLLLVMGSEDRVTSRDLARAFFDRVATKDKTFELVEGAFHVLFEDFEREQVLRHIAQWLDARFPSLSARTDGEEEKEEKEEEGEGRHDAAPVQQEVPKAQPQPAPDAAPDSQTTL